MSTKLSSHTLRMLAAMQKDCENFNANMSTLGRLHGDVSNHFDMIEEEESLVEIRHILCEMHDLAFDIEISHDPAEFKEEQKKIMTDLIQIIARYQRNED